jgi:hypothetical protein
VERDADDFFVSAEVVKAISGEGAELELENYQDTVSKLVRSSHGSIDLAPGNADQAAPEVAGEL